MGSKNQGVGATPAVVEIKGWAGDYAVYCAHDAIVDTGKLVPNPRNPYNHPDQQIALLTKIIAAQGWRAPITVSKRSGFIVRGHARLMAAELLGCKAPVDYQSYENEAAEYADLIADNRLAELAEFNRPMAKDLLEELSAGQIDTDLTGFDQLALEDLMTELHVWSPDDDLPEGAGELSKRVIITFKNDTEVLEFWAKFGQDHAPVNKVIFRWGELNG